jgi:hypothetical protein
MGDGVLVYFGYPWRTLRTGLGAALMLVKGFAAPETGHAYARDRDLWQQLGSPSEFLNVPYGQSYFATKPSKLLTTSATVR